MDLLEPVIDGLGNDFLVIRMIGEAVLSGLSPYSIEGSFYPPATSLLFSFFALLPAAQGFLALTILNTSMLVLRYRLKALAILLFIPMAHIFAFGQIDIFFLMAIPLLWNENDWIAGAGAAILTLKPQIAATVLPWFLIRMLIHKEMRGRLLITTFCILGVHAAPIFIRPTIYTEWINTLSAATENKLAINAGIWGLVSMIPIWFLIPISLLCMLFLLTDDEKSSRAALAVANPTLSYYDTIILLDIAPLKYTVPVSMIDFGLAHLLNTYAPFAMITIFVLVWRINEVMEVAAATSELKGASSSSITDSIASGTRGY